jgi:putative flippase GtrA
MPRPVRFVVVGALGFAAQAMVLLLLTAIAHWPVVVATAVAVETAVLVNFVWHERLTWRDRPAGGATRLQRFVRFHAANGLMSLIGTVALTWLGVRVGLRPLAANAAAVCAMAAVNYRAADRWVFTTAAIATSLWLAAPGGASAAELKPETLAAWERHVAQVERSLDSDLNEPPHTEPRGQTIDVPSGTISEWSGSILIPDRTVADVVNTLLFSSTLPAPPEVVSARVLGRDGDTLRTYMRLVRKALVTVTYDTEHEVRYTRLSPSLATSRSVATKIAEAGGDDRGFMWRLQSYWRYRQVGNDVRIDMRSLTLSRGTPWMLKPIAGPIVDRIGRESVRSTLEAVARFLADTAAASARRPPLVTPGGARAALR